MLAYLQSMGELHVESALRGGGGGEARARRVSGGSAGSADAKETCHECVTLQQQADQLREQVSVLERSRQLSEREAARAKELTVRKDKQLMDLQSKTREQEAKWAEAEKRLHRRSVQTAQEGHHLAAEAQSARASHESAVQQAAARLAAAEARLTDAERIIAQLKAQLQSTSGTICAKSIDTAFFSLTRHTASHALRWYTPGADEERELAEEEKARADTRAGAQSAECTQLRVRLAEAQGESDRYRERAREAEAAVSLASSSSEGREAAATVERERQAADEREKRLLEQVASLRLKLERASTTEPQAAACVECLRR